MLLFYNPGVSGCHNTLFLSSPHRSLIIGLVLDLIVSYVDTLMSKKSSCGPNVSNHCRSLGRGFGSGKTCLYPQLFITDRSKAVLLLWFLSITCYVCMCMVFSNFQVSQYVVCVESLSLISSFFL